MRDRQIRTKSADSCERIGRTNIGSVSFECPFFPCFTPLIASLTIRVTRTAIVRVGLLSGLTRAAKRHVCACKSGSANVVNGRKTISGTVS